jgi:hypothetical protein
LQQFNEYQKPVVERAGFSEQNMQMLNEAKIEKTKFNVLGPKYVMKNCPKNGAIAMVCQLRGFDWSSFFDAQIDDIKDIKLRGMPVNAKGGEPVPKILRISAIENSCGKYAAFDVS